MILKTKKFSVYEHKRDNRSSDIHSISCRRFYHSDASSEVNRLDNHENDDNYKYAQLTFSKLYDGISYSDTCNASLSERREYKTKFSGMVPYTLTYGEISDIDCLYKIIQFLRSADLLPKNGIFYDLGSGIGRPVFCASLLHPFDKCIGIELLSKLHSISLQMLNKWTEYIQTHDASHRHMAQIAFIQGSILDTTLIDWTDGDVVFANSTCFDNSMMQMLFEISQTMKLGSIFITLSQSLINATLPIADNNCSEQQVAHWKVVRVTREIMSW